jgi:hypothetical protein
MTECRARKKDLAPPRLTIMNGSPFAPEHESRLEILPSLGAGEHGPEVDARLRTHLDA